MKTITVKSIRIAGWLSDREIGQGKTALWTGKDIQEVLEIGPNFYWEDDEVEAQLKAAQEYADKMVAQNNWYIEPKAFIDVFEADIDEEE